MCKSFQNEETELKKEGHRKFLYNLINHSFFREKRGLMSEIELLRKQALRKQSYV